MYLDEKKKREVSEQQTLNLNNYKEMLVGEMKLLQDEKEVLQEENM